MTDSASPAQSPSIAGRDWGTLCLLGAIWGASFVFIDVTREALPPATVVALRIGLAALALWPVAALTGALPPLRLRFWAAALLVGVITTAAPFNLLTWGQHYGPSNVDPGLAAILNASTTFWSVLTAHFLTSDEKITRRRAAGVLLGLAGVVIAIGPEKLLALDPTAAGQAAIIGGTLFYAFGLIIARRLTEGSRIGLTTASLTMAGALSVIYALWMDGGDGFEAMLSASAPLWGAILGVALLSTAFAYVLFYQLVGRIGAANTGMVTLLVPVAAILFAVLLLGRTPPEHAYAGFALIGLGLLVIDGRILGWGGCQDANS